jgi:hypothetical protein
MTDTTISDGLLIVSKLSQMQVLPSSRCRVAVASISGTTAIVKYHDREMARLFDNPRRSHALTMLAQIRSQGLLTEDEFSSLSPETRGAIQMLLGAG